MKSNITKLAAATVIIVAVVLGLNITGGPDMASVTWAEVIEKVEQISVLTFEMTTEISYPGNKTLSIQSENYVAGDYGTPIRILLIQFTPKIKLICVSTCQMNRLLKGKTRMIQEHGLK
ncbi:MAG: hypothetical protein ACYSSN_05830 [Planctomycetota bacterium]